ncbi:MAG: hypothetical protein L6262_01495 [Weeksellaceae bacterium]|nr:hypothetical protein [Weeksellaceae bacterium]
MVTPNAELLMFYNVENFFVTAKTFVGDRETLTEKLTRFAKDYKPDEIIVSGNIYDFEAKQKSYKIASEIIKSL